MASKSAECQWVNFFIKTEFNLFLIFVKMGRNSWKDIYAKTIKQLAMAKYLSCQWKLQTMHYDPKSRWLGLTANPPLHWCNDDTQKECHTPQFPRAWLSSASLGEAFPPCHQRPGLLLLRCCPPPPPECVLARRNLGSLQLSDYTI